MRTHAPRGWTASFVAAALGTMLGVAHVSAAAELAGVTFPGEISVEGRTLELQGLGLRRKFLFKVYVGALYLAAPTTEATEAIRSAGPKRIAMHFLRHVGEDKIRETFDEGFFNNSQERLELLRERIEGFHRALAGGVEKGQEVSFTYVPQEGTRVAVDGSVRGTIPGKDFMEALWAVWLGEIPGDQELKRGMLGLP